MPQIPDAPWIRDAEMYGYPENEVPDPVCPCCGYQEPEQIYLMDGDAIGCDHCIKFVDAWDWAAEEYEKHKEDGYYD